MANTPTDSRWREIAPKFPSIKVHIALFDELSPSSQQKHSEEWWYRFIEKGSKDPASAPILGKTRCEWILQHKFPEELRQEWVKHFRPHRGPDAASILPAQFAFRVAEIEYGTLSFILEIIGVEPLAKLLDGSLDLFQVLTEIYVPRALVNAFDLDRDLDYLDFSYTSSGEFIRAFSSQSTSNMPTQQQVASNGSRVAPSTGSFTTTPPATGGAAGLKSFILMNNLTWIVPLVVTIGVVLWGSWQYGKTRDLLSTQQLEFTKLMVEQHKAVIDAQTQRNTQMERLTLDALRLAQPLPAKAGKTDGKE